MPPSIRKRPPPGEGGALRTRRYRDRLRQEREVLTPVGFTALAALKTALDGIPSATVWAIYVEIVTTHPELKQLIDKHVLPESVSSTSPSGQLPPHGYFVQSPHHNPENLLFRLVKDQRGVTLVPKRLPREDERYVMRWVINRTEVESGWRVVTVDRVDVRCPVFHSEEDARKVESTLVLMLANPRLFSVPRQHTGSREVSE